jgi:hypothetical protein
MIDIVMQRLVFSTIILSVFIVLGRTYGFYKKWKINAHPKRKHLREILSPS